MDELTKQEIAYLQQKVAADHLAYLNYRAAYGLSEDEIQRLEWIKALGDKLAALRAAKEAAHG